MKKVVLFFVFLFLIILARNVSAVTYHREWSSWGECKATACGSDNGTQTRSCYNKVGSGTHKCPVVGKTETRSCKTTVTACPTAIPTVEPTAVPTEEPTPTPTEEPTPTPTEEVTPTPTVEPTVEPTVTPEPTKAPVSSGNSGGGDLTNYTTGAPYCGDPMPGTIVWYTIDRGVAGDGKVRLNWALPRADKISIRYREANEGWKYGVIGIPNSGTFEVSSLKNGVKYVFQLVGVNGCRGGVWSVEKTQMP